MNDKQYTLGSLFDGSGGFPLAGSLCGIRPVWASEVEPYPIAVTKSRFPNLIHLGDISKINGGSIPPVDIITFGSPCQDLSVAGKRAGLKHEANGDEETTRSGLFMEAVRIIKEMRKATNGQYPRWALWENVPGAYSSNKGEDFRVVCEELIKIVEPAAVMPPVPKNGWPYADSYVGDGWSLAYRTFDAQYWGVPQRRRRIHLVVDFRGECARKVLFERKGLRGYFETGRTPWQSPAGDAENGSGAADREGESERGNCLTPWDVQSRRIFSVDGPWPALYIGEGGGHGYACIPYTMKIRSGCEGGGKGALVQEDKSATLSCNNDQYLFQPTIDGNILDDQGGSQINVRTDGKSPTLRAEMHGNVPCVLDAVGFCTEHSAQSRGIGFQEEVAPTLRAGVTPAVAFSIENHPADSRVNIDESGKVQTLTSRMGTGGGNVPMVMEQKVLCMATQQGGAEIMEDKCPTITASAGMSGNNQPVACYVDTTHADDVVRVDEMVAPLQARDHKGGKLVCLQGNGIDRADTAGCNGKGWKEDTCYTLNTIDRPAVAFAMQGFGDYKESEVSSGLKARDYKDATDLVCGVDCRNMNEYPELYPILQAKPNGGQSLNFSGAVRVQYIVRRLTPTECARLQGFADLWGHIDQKEDFTEEEYRFWLDVRNTHAAINGKATKDYPKDQMLTWYNKLHTDSAEYKMWGNGIALPPAIYCMQGIMDAFATTEPTITQDEQTEDIAPMETLTIETPQPQTEQPLEQATISETEEPTIKEEPQEDNMNKPIRTALKDHGHDDAFLFESPDFDTAIIGVTSDGRVVYDYDTMVKSLMTEATEEEAADFVDNVTIKSLRFIRDKKHPIIMHRLTI